MEPKTLAEALDWIDWYRRCLEDIQDRRPVRGLAEAKAGYDAAYQWLISEAIEEDPSLHTCPFAVEIHGDYRLCDCDEELEYECRMDI